MAYRLIRIRGANKSASSFDTLLPQTCTSNVFRDDSSGILEQSLVCYDRHLGNTLTHVNRALSTGTATALLALCPGVMLVDGLPLLLELHVDLELEPTLSFNGSAPAPIVDSNGYTIPGGQIAGSSLFLIWNARHKKWYIMNNDAAGALTHVMVPGVLDYTYQSPANEIDTVIIPNFNKNEDALTVNYNQTVLRLHIDYEFVAENAIRLLRFTLDSGDQLAFRITKYTEVVKRGCYSYELEEINSIYTTTHDNTTAIPLPLMTSEMYRLDINYNQTVLRNGIDYTHDGERHIRLMTPLNKGEQLVFQITRYVEKNGALTGLASRGSYRYNINVIHESYTPDDDNVSKVIVPNYNRLRDELSVILDNHLLVRDVDYVVDELSNVILLTHVLNHDDTIYFTILQGAMIDVPKLNMAEAYGDGKDLKVDISYEEVHDFYTLILKLGCTLQPEATLKFIEGPAEPLVDSNGRYINSECLPGSFIYVVYNKAQKCWYCLGGLGDSSTGGIPMSGEANFPGQIYIPSEPVQKLTETVVHHGLGKAPKHIRITPCEPPTIKDGVVQDIGDIWAYADEENLYVGSTGTSTSKFHWELSNSSLGETISVVAGLDKRVEEFNESMTKFKDYIDRFAKEENFTIFRRLYTVPNPIPKRIPVEGFDRTTDSILVNMGQTILRENIDYFVSVDNTIAMLGIDVKIGTTFEFLIIRRNKIDLN